MGFVGIDVSKGHLDVSERPSGELLRVTNDDLGLTALLTWLQSHPATLVVLEATGGARRRGQSAAGARLRQGCGQAGQD
jgi:transposase